MKNKMKPYILKIMIKRQGKGENHYDDEHLVTLNWGSVQSDTLHSQLQFMLIAVKGISSLEKKKSFGNQNQRSKS